MFDIQKYKKVLSFLLWFFVWHYKFIEQDINWGVELKKQTFFFFCIFSDHHIRRSDPTRSTSENLPFSISRLLSKSNSNESVNNHNNNNIDSDRKSVEKDLSDNENGKVSFSSAGLQYTATGGIYSYPLYTTSGVLRVPPQRGYPPHGLHPAFPLHPAAALALKDRLAGE